MVYEKAVCDTGAVEFAAWYYSIPRSFLDLRAYMAVGIGDTAWDDAMVAPATTDTALVSEYCRVKPYLQQPLDDTLFDYDKLLYKETGELVFRFVAEFPGSILTNLKQVGVYVREVGLFIDAGDEADSGYLFVVERHPRIWWGAGWTLRREILVDLRG